MPQISVIVPIYNAERWLRRCVDSILAQTFTDFELLLIDDGSTDGSGAIIDAYAAADPRVRPFHKPNGGVSSARNLGLDHATGEFITFIDSDDWIDDGYLNDLIIHKECDIVLSYYSAIGWKEWVSHPYEEREYNVDNIYHFLDKYLISCNTPWCKLFKRDIIINHHILFNPSLSYGEDTLFVLEYLKYVGTIYCSSNSFYKYNCENVGLSSNFDVNKLIDLINLMSTEIDELSVVYNWNCAKVKDEIIALSSARLFKQLDYGRSDALGILKNVCNNKNIRSIINSRLLKKSNARKGFDMLLRLKAYRLIIWMMKFKKIYK